ncbi:thioesterase family protein [Spongiibacter taiwanensis]|uniref:acyl-CoA thioesterase domain-containing protein n=1 Tax=Spongiibacter taiwanensis TaxID=1748242 RepID=UPI002034D5E0|nr:acyl-CoA thioesterase domain-containing protein [Spongiibacter taiwanensis]USA42624.1 thioesterase family protein [Spongiibacter taiwanensis]
MSQWDPATLSTLSPYSRTLNLRYRPVVGSKGCVQLVPSASNRGAGSGELDRRCIVGLIDHAMGYTLQASGAGLMPGATLNLRVDFESFESIEGGLEAVCRVRQRHSGGALLVAEVSTGAGLPVALGTSFFTQRTFPGKVGLEEARLSDYQPGPEIHCYAQGIGLSALNGCWQLAGGHLGAVGWEPGNTFHGGAVGSLLVASAEAVLAADMRIVSLSISYLRPSRADLPLQAQCRPVRLGGSASFYTVQCYQQDQRKPVAVAEVCCVREALNDSASGAGTIIRRST